MRKAIGLTILCGMLGVTSTGNAQTVRVDCSKIGEITSALAVDLPYYQSFAKGRGRGGTDSGGRKGSFEKNLRSMERRHGLPDGRASALLAPDAIACRYVLPEPGRMQTMAYWCSGISAFDNSAATASMQAFALDLAKRVFSCPSKGTFAYFDRPRDFREKPHEGGVLLHWAWRSGATKPASRYSSLLVGAKPRVDKREGRNLAVVEWNLHLLMTESSGN